MRDVEIIKIANGYLAMRPRGGHPGELPSYDRMYCFQTLQLLFDWLERELGRSSPEKGGLGGGIARESVGTLGD